MLSRPGSLLNLIRIDGIIIYLSLESYCSQGMARQAGRTQAGSSQRCTLAVYYLASRDGL
jgi:hypothetical protein